MRTLENRVAQLEFDLAQAKRELARKESRPAAPLAARNGRYLGKTNADLEPGGVVDVTVWIWEATGSVGWVETSTVIEDVGEFCLEDGQTLLAGSSVYCFYYETTWVLLPQEFGAGGVVRFELTATLALSGHAAAKLMKPDGSGAWEVTDPLVEIEIYDPFGSEGMWAGISGYQGWAFPRGESYLDTVPDPDDTRPAYDIIWMEQIARTIEFTTTEYMGQSTAGRLVSCDVTFYDEQGVSPGSTVDVRDPQGKYPDVPVGAKGSAYYDYHNGYYRIRNCQRVAIFAEALLTADSCASAMSMDNFAIKPVGEFILPPPTTPTVPTNSCDFAGLDNDRVLLRRINNTLPNPTWEVIAIDVHAKTVMVDVQVTGLTLQKKEITIYTQVCTTTAPSWETWHTGDDCDP